MVCYLLFDREIFHMMSKPRLATIINFCTNESRFLTACIEQCLLFSKQIIIPVCDHFFNGVAEDQALLEQIYRAFPDCQFVEYPFLPKRIPRRVFRKIDPPHFWPSAARTIASVDLDDEVEQVLFIDADEIPDGKRMAEWLELSDYSQYTVQRLSNYWYFREPRYRACALEDTPVLVQKRSLDRFVLLNEGERDAIANLLPGPKRRGVKGLDGEPLIHHFSWVRTQEEMLRKVESWSHQNDRDWKSLVQEEFSRPFNGVDFVHGYQFQECVPPFEVSLGPVQFKPKDRPPQVKRLLPTEVLERLGIYSDLWRKIFSLFSFK